MKHTADTNRGNILLSCAGRRAYLVSWFKEALGPRGKVIAIDADASAPALQEADLAFVVPTVRTPGYSDGLWDLCKAFDVGLIISLNDLELQLLSEHKADWIAEGVYPVGAPPDRVRQCLDKVQTEVLAREAGVRYPPTFQLLEEAITWFQRRDRDSEEIIVKARWGSASIGMGRASHVDELQEAWRRGETLVSSSVVSYLREPGAPAGVVAQPVIRGAEFGLDLVHDLDGRPASYLGRRKLSMRAGETDKAISVEEPALVEAGRRLSTVLQHSGVADCDFIQSPEGWVLLDINPRFGGGYPFSHAAGANVPRAMVAWLHGDTVDPDWLQAEPGTVASKCDRIVVVESEGVQVRSNARLPDALAGE